MYFGKSFQKVNFLISFNSCDILLREQIFKAHVTKLLIHAVWRFQVTKLV